MMTPNQHLAAAMRAARVLPPVISSKEIASKPTPVLDFEAVTKPERIAPPALPPVVAEPTGEPWATPAVDELDLPVPDLLRLVALAHGLTVDDLRGQVRRADLVEARSEFCYRAARRAGVSSVVIGKAIRRDHATVRHAIGRYCERHGLPAPCGKVDLVEERQRRIARSTAGYHRRRLANRMTQEERP